MRRWLAALLGHRGKLSRNDAVAKEPPIGN